MSREEFIAYLHRQIKRLGEQKRYAEAIGVSPAYLNDVLNGKAPGKKILDGAGFERVITYQRKDR